YDTARCAAVLGIRTGRDDLELLNSIECDVDRCTLAACLLSKEAVIVIPAVKTDIVEDTALAGEVYLVSVRALRNCNTWCKRQQILELATEDRCIFDRRLVKSG